MAEHLSNENILFMKISFVLFQTGCHSVKKAEYLQNITLAHNSY